MRVVSLVLNVFKNMAVLPYLLARLSSVFILLGNDHLTKQLCVQHAQSGDHYSEEASNSDLQGSYKGKFRYASF